MLDSEESLNFLPINITHTIFDLLLKIPRYSKAFKAINHPRAFKRVQRKCKWYWYMYIHKQSCLSQISKDIVLYTWIVKPIDSGTLPPPLNLLTILFKYLKQFSSLVCISAKAVEDVEVKNDPSWDCNFRSCFQSKSDIPSKLYSKVVGILCIISLGILFPTTPQQTH